MKIDLDQKDMRFLVGSGISSQLPMVNEVVISLFKVLVGEEEAGELRRYIEVKKKADLSKHIRFERVLQLVKDYLDPDLKVIVDLYSMPVRPNAYHEFLAHCMRYNGAIVYTTNIDRQIERAYERLYNTPLEPGKQLIKLHGCISHPSSMGVTFKVIANRLTPDVEARMKGDLESGPLCVIGYSGSDVWDVMPILEETRSDHDLYWFDYKKGNRGKRTVKNGVYECAEIVNTPEDRRRRSHFILEKIVKRRGEKVFLIVGNERCPYWVDRNRHEDLERCSLIDGERERCCGDDVDAFAEKWITEMVRSKEIECSLAAIDLCNEVGLDGMGDALAEKLKRFKGCRKSYLIHSKLAMVVYSGGLSSEKFEQAEQLAGKGIEEARKVLEGNTLNEEDRKRAYFALNDSYDWCIESLRINGHVRRALELYEEWGRVASELKERHGLTEEWSYLEGEFLQLGAMLALEVGGCRSAHSKYAAAGKWHRRVGEMPGSIYCRGGLADVRLTMGLFDRSMRMYDLGVRYASDAGWHGWSDEVHELCRIEIRRIWRDNVVGRKKDRLKSDRAGLEKERMRDVSALKKIGRSRYDKSNAFTAKVLLCELQMDADAESCEQAVCRYRKIMRRTEKNDPDYYFKMCTNYAEVLRRRGEHREASDLAHKAADYFSKKGQELRALRARTILSYIHGRPARELYRRFKEMRCFIGMLYTRLLESRCEDDVLLIRYAEKNRLYYLREVLEEAKGVDGVRVLFPGSLFL
jgi:hypothetical protein